MPRWGIRCDAANQTRATYGLTAFRILGRDHREAFLLVEAIMTIVVIAVGLVFITQGLGGSLKALAALTRYDRLLRLAESQLDQLQAEVQQFHLLASREGEFETPDQDYRWSVSLAPVQSEDMPESTAAVMCSVTVTVSHAADPSPAVRIQSLWPASWVASVCF